MDERPNFLKIGIGKLVLKKSGILRPCNRLGRMDAIYNLTSHKLQVIIF